mmetsp:Transcript_54814/g.133123  ORF Transcript_54814/g.133123 Transcript_54814/m.133123 type:complete len:223 (+) Transcript_54814:206-874(+)
MQTGHRSHCLLNQQCLHPRVGLSAHAPTLSILMPLLRLGLPTVFSMSRIPSVPLLRTPFLTIPFFVHPLTAVLSAVPDEVFIPLSDDHSDSRLYCQQVDAASGDLDPDWQITKILDHHRIRRCLYRRLQLRAGRPRWYTHLGTQVCVIFANGDTAWTSLSTVRLQDPLPLVLYALQRRLQKTTLKKMPKRVPTLGSVLKELADMTLGKIQHPHFYGNMFQEI